MEYFDNFNDLSANYYGNISSNDRETRIDFGCKREIVGYLSRNIMERVEKGLFQQW